MAIGMLGIGAVAVVATTTTIITTAEALTVGCPEDLKFVIEASNGNCVREVNTDPLKWIRVFSSD